MTHRAAADRNVVALMGGLGNQLHQVAYGRWLEQQTGFATVFDVSHMRFGDFDSLVLSGIGEYVRQRMLTKTRWWPTPEHRHLGKVGQRLRAASGPPLIVRDYSSPGADVSPGPAGAWWFGFWQRLDCSETLVPELRAALVHAGDQRRADRTIGVHVRRGDMLRTPMATPAGWFQLALSRLRSALGQDWADAEIRVWSDDPEWCSNHLELGGDFEVGRHESPIDDLAELSRCGAMLISRSTFSWWAARVAAERGVIVAYPAPWWPDYAHQERIIPATWLPMPLSTTDSRGLASAGRALQVGRP